MRTRFFVSLLSLLALGSVGAPAQTNLPPAPPTPSPHVKDVPQPGEASAPVPAATPAPASPTASEPTPAQLAEFQKRFQQGQELEKEGKLLEARTVFDGIIADSPEAKGSLREAGFISVQLNDLPKASEYFEKLHALVPDYPAAIEALIQINQSLKRDVKVEMLIREFHDLRAAGKVQLPYFVRERIHLDQGGEIVFSEFFDYKQEPNTVWMAEEFDANNQLLRRLLLNYDPESTQELRAKDPKFANAEQFLLIEDVLKDGSPVRIDAYFQMFSLPEYKKIRNTMLAVLGGAYKPVYSQTVPAPAAQ